MEHLLGFTRPAGEASKAALFGRQDITLHVNDAMRRAAKEGVPCESSKLAPGGKRAAGSELRQSMVALFIAGERHPYCPCCNNAYHRNRAGLDSGANGKGGPRPHSPTIHRIYPDRGYVKGNMRLICYSCNMAIGDIGGNPENATVRARALAWQAFETQT